MWKYLLHLWAVPEQDLPLACPAPAEGQPADPQGFYDYLSVAASFDQVVFVSTGVVLVFVLLCYLATSVSLGSRFVWRWWGFLVLTALVTGAGTWYMLTNAPTRALAGSCETNPDAFLVALPESIVLERALAGTIWAALAFVVLSIVLARLVGHFAHAKNGFFHNRGCPWPRFTP